MSSLLGLRTRVVKCGGLAGSARRLYGGPRGRSSRWLLAVGATAEFRPWALLGRSAQVRVTASSGALAVEDDR